jgi:hypothetical protein
MKGAFGHRDFMEASRRFLVIAVVCTRSRGEAERDDGQDGESAECGRFRPSKSAPRGHVRIERGGAVVLIEVDGAQPVLVFFAMVCAEK